METKKDFKSLFHDSSLEGWRIVPRWIRMYKEGTPEYENAWIHKGQWTMCDGILEGRQDPPGCGWGSNLVSEESFGDFELVLEAKPDWPADTGIYLRTSEDGCLGYQVLLDYRKSGSIGGFYGNGFGFHAINFTLDADTDEKGALVRLKVEDPATTVEPLTPEKSRLLKYKITGEEFLNIWKLNDWNEFRILVQGEIPVITTFINGTKVAEIDMNDIDLERYSMHGATAHFKRGHISLEVHDNDRLLGKNRWGENSACRWRNMRIREL